MLTQAQLLYEISGNGAKSKSYLLAVNRYMDIAFLDTIPNVFTCFGRCNHVVTEFVMQDYEAIAALRTAALLPDSVKLSNFYSAAEYDDIDAALRISLGMGLDQLCRMKPSYLTEMYRNELMKQWLQFDESRTMDRFFEGIAAQQDIPITGLDGVGETMYMLFDREPFHHQCEELRRIIEYPEREVQLERSLRDMYMYGRLTDIAYLVSGPDNQSTLSYSDYRVYAQRNVQWVKRLTPILKEGNCFITLNAIFLGGDEGLISQLRKAGFRIRPVNRRMNAKKTN